MREIKLGPIDNPTTIKIPTDATEILWRDWVEFEGVLDQLHHVEKDDEGVQILVRLYRAMEIFNPDLKLMDLPLFHNQDEAISTLGYVCKEIRETLNNAPALPIKAEDYRLDYKGEWYGLGRSMKDLEGNERKIQSAREMVEYQNFERYMAKVRTERGDAYEAGEDAMNDRFSYTRFQMASVLYKKDEVRPISQTEYDAFITERGKHFAELPMSAVRDVAAFFLSTYIGLDKNQHIGTSLKAQQGARWNREKRAAKVVQLKPSTN